MRLDKRQPIDHFDKYRNEDVEMIARLYLVEIMSRLFAKPLELCCPGGARNEAVERLRRDGLHFGRLR